MYLINVKTMQLEFFQDDRNLIYAILSHRWQEDEVLFQHMQSGNAPQRKGYAKLKRFCEEAATANYAYAWCDTCCIDKSSSAELSESINSMFRWYQNAAVCFAYLYDLNVTTVGTAEDFQSEWFTRGWCLQELLAPKEMVFFNASWERVGTRHELSQIVVEMTGIRVAALGGDLEQFSVAQRMSWAADRKTTRGEDVAYSLLGIFGVSMPLLYGEGEKRAFARLQDEIMKQSPDQSVLVHSSRGDQSLLAESPADFRDSSSIVQAVPLVGEPHSLTNVGLSMSLLLYSWSLEVYIGLLDCCDEEDKTYVGIFLQLRPQLPHRNATFSAEHVVRIKVNGQAWVSQPQLASLPCSQMKLYLERSLGSWEPRRYGFWVRRFERKRSRTKNPATRVWAVSRNKWDEEERIIELPDGTFGTAGIVICEDDTGFRTVVRLGFTSDFAPIVEFGGDDCLRPRERGGKTIHIISSDGFSYERDGPPDPSITKERVLSDMAWVTANNNTRGSVAVRLQAAGRDQPFREHGCGGVSVEHYVFCRKLVVDGTITWVVDILWQFVVDAWQQPVDGPDREAICDCCEERIYGTRHQCAECLVYDLCRLCIGDAKRVHEPTHKFNSI